MSDALWLRPVAPDDLPIFFVQQADPEAVWMAAFTAKDPTDRAAFDALQARTAADERIIVRTIVVDGAVAGSVLLYEEGGRSEVSYWIGRTYWGQGIATRALALFLREVAMRPLYARVAKDNAASRRVLEKNGFVVMATERGFANARGEEIDELVLMLETYAADGWPLP